MSRFLKSLGWLLVIPLALPLSLLHAGRMARTGHPTGFLDVLPWYFAAATVVAIAFILWRFHIDSLWRRVRSASPTAKIFECVLSDATAGALKKVIGPPSFRLGQGYVITADDEGITFYGHGAPAETAGTTRWSSVAAMTSGYIHAADARWIGVTLEVARHGGVAVPLLIRPTTAFAGVRRGDYASSSRALRAFEGLKAKSESAAGDA